jgi:PASTA domain
LRRLTGVAALFAATVVMLSLAAVASAETVIVGSPLTGTPTVYEFCLPLCIGVDKELPPGAQATVPAGSYGMVTSWRMLDGSGRYQLRVLRPNEFGEYVLAGTSAVVDAAGIGIETFSTELPVQTGDVIGLENLELTDKLAVIKVPYARRLAFFYEATPPPAPEGAHLIEPGFKEEKYAGEELAFNVSIGPPESSSPSPPPSPTPTPQPAPENKSAKQCKVPALKGKTLKAAKKALLGADCKPGTVTTKKGAGHPPKVVTQSPAAGKVRAAGTKVHLTLG